MTDHATNSEPVNGMILGDLNGENKTRWIRVSVEMLEHDAFAGDPFSRRDAWLWLIANAAWKPRRFKVAKLNRMIELQRGQTLAAREYLAEKWGWGEKKVRNFLEFLATENMIEMGQSKGRFANIVTICNYDKYQNSNSDKGQLKGQLTAGLEAGSGPVEGQTLTKNTNTTNLDSSSTVLVEAAGDATELLLSDFKNFTDRLIAAAEPCLDNLANCQGLLSAAVPRMWLESGADFERDVIPTLQAIGQRDKGKRIRSWDYFTRPVAEAKVKRERGLPNVVVPAAKPSLPKTRAPSRLRGDDWKDRVAQEMVDSGLANVIN